MSLHRIAVLFRKELKYSSRSFFFVFAVAAPMLLTIMVQFNVDSLFSDKPKLGITDQGNSQVVKSLDQTTSIDLKKYSSEMEIKDAVARGARDVGIVVPIGFDQSLTKKESVKITAYIWGESLLKNRAMASSAFIHQVREITGEKSSVDIVAKSLGDQTSVSWEARLLPLIVLMAVFMNGFLIPSTSLVDEKQKRTIGAVLITPATQSEVFLAKASMGSVMSIFMGIIVLVLNHVFQTQLALIIFILFLGAVLASCFGLIIGAFMNDIALLYSVIKGLGIFLYGPGIVYMFPQIPQWVGKVFPTYYVMQPILEITQNGGNWNSVRFHLVILIGIILVCLAAVLGIARKTNQQEG